MPSIGQQLQHTFSTVKRELLQEGRRSFVSQALRDLQDSGRVLIRDLGTYFHTPNGNAYPVNTLTVPITWRPQDDQASDAMKTSMVYNMIENAMFSIDYLIETQCLNGNTAYVSSSYRYCLGTTTQYDNLQITYTNLYTIAGFVPLSEGREAQTIRTTLGEPSRLDRIIPTRWSGGDVPAPARPNSNFAERLFAGTLIEL